MKRKIFIAKLLHAIKAAVMDEKVIEKVAPKKQRINWAAVYQYLLDYCQDTTIHGFKYIGATDRPWLERIFWMISFIISTIGCAMLISEMFEKLQTNPITVSLAERPSSIQEIAFPSVSICPEIQTTFDSGFNFRTIVDAEKSFDFDSLDDLDKARLQAISFICKPEYLKRVNFSTQTGNLVEVMRSLVSTTWFKQQSASWNKIYGASFALRLTPYGFCFTFNVINDTDLLHKSEVSSDFFFTRDENLYKRDFQAFSAPPKSVIDFNHDFPWSATISGSDSGLSVALRSNEGSTNWSCSRYEGFRYFIHGTNELLSSTNRFHLQFGELTELLIKPKMTITEEDLRDYTLERRNCFFNGEKQLRYFKQYTKYNCEQECLSNYTAKKCNCVKFSVIRDKSTPICTNQQLECFENAENELFNDEISFDSKSEKSKYRDLIKCACLPQCESIKYELELVKTNYKIHLTEYQTLATLKVFFKDNEFVPLKRFQLYGTVDFLANCGGLLGLFVGVSVLSIVEIFYYFILRLACIMRNPDIDNEDKTDGEKDLDKIEKQTQAVVPVENRERY
ncbi:hypothetical protein PVAND_011670 [Polypedilum vanderplanki]|uniref:Uncharacterized protein n=1 Tax=Polypedilum vanderplanki TaxID=319348 RepID=A0A9J6CKB8_POLVA|nr:hypothetical protein PVAND_011670 [Polypedilum vanderplanki]